MPLAFSWLRLCDVRPVDWPHVQIEPPLLRGNLRRMALSTASATPCRRLVFVDIDIYLIPGLTSFPAVGTGAHLDAAEHGEDYLWQTAACQRCLHGVLDIRSLRHFDRHLVVAPTRLLSGSRRRLAG